MKDYYYILGINENADLKEIQKAYRKLAVKFHPKENSKDAFYTHYFRNISEAYQVLSDQHRRYRYDKQRDDFFNTPRSKKRKVNVPPPVITSFFASKKACHVDDLITLSWEVLNADSIHINPIGQVASNGSQTIRLQEDKMQGPNILFDIQASNTEGAQSVSKQVEITNLDYYKETKAVPQYDTPEGPSKKKKVPQQRKKKKRKKQASTQTNPPTRRSRNQTSAYIMVGAMIFLIVVMLYIIYSLNPFL